MSERRDIVNQFVNVYRSLTEHPTLSSAEILKLEPGSDFIKISSKWSQRNIVKGEMSKFQKYHIFKPLTSEIVFESTPVDVSSEQLSRFSKSGKFQCVLRELKLDNKKKQFLEIWSQGGLFKNFDVAAFDVHKDIYYDCEFGSLEWSPSEDKILYIAEKKIKKSGPFFKQISQKDKQAEDNEQYVGDEYLYRSDWGEQLVDKHQPVVGICDLKSETLKVLDGIPPNFSPGQVLWSKDDNIIFGIVLENEPRRLGLIYCSNRNGYIFQLSLKGDFKILSDSKNSVSSPRLSPDGTSLYWLQRPSGGAHGGTLELIKYDIASSKKKLLIPVIRSVNKEFSGLYMHYLPIRCFSKDGTKLFFSSCNKLKVNCYCLDLGSKKVQLLETGNGSSTILDVHEDIVLISSSSIQQPPSLKISNSISKIEFVALTNTDVICKDSVVEEIEFNSTTPNEKFTYYNAIYYGPPPPKTSGQTVPLILYPHGGPHSVFTNDYSLEANFFVSLGYGVLMVNYRGSTGVGQDGIDFLMGKISVTDVKDNHEAVLYALKNFSFLNPKNVFLYGKSHGGYLVEQLSCQYPEFYRAVVSLNPVTDVFAMYTMSDIPDWATSECGLPFDESKPLTQEQANKIIATSPVQLSDKIKAPTLFLIGKKDLRVPYYEGMRMYNALKARNVKTRLNLYDDNHTLGSVPVHIDCTINSALWFTENKA